MMVPPVPWWKPALVVAGSLVLGWAGWRLWTTGNPRALIPWSNAAGQGAAAYRGQGAMPGPDYDSDCGCGG